MKKAWIVTWALLLGGAMFWTMATPAWAAWSVGSGTPKRGCAYEPLKGVGNNQSAYIGALVADRQNETLGTVSDVTVDSGGMVNFLIVTPCLPGMTDRLVPVLYRTVDITFPASVDRVTVNLTKEDFKGAPSFSAGQWPTEVNSGWAQRAFNYYEKVL
jgi:hypothetical protein